MIKKVLLYITIRGVNVTFMKLLRQTTELSVVATFSVLFAGYAVFIYPFEKLNEKLSSEVREKKVKYATFSQG